MRAKILATLLATIVITRLLIADDWEVTNPSDGWSFTTDQNVHANGFGVTGKKAHYIIHKKGDITKKYKEDNTKLLRQAGYGNGLTILYRAGQTATIR